jgi:uncharacterized transporter YbjL
MTYKDKIVMAIASVVASINKLLAQQWVWDEIDRDRQDTSSDGFSFGGIIVLCLLIAFIWLISKGIKVGKEEHARRMEQRKQNEKRTDDILSNMDDFINSLNNKEE